MDRTLNWGVIGSGHIARTFADALEHSSRANFVGVASRTPDRPDIVDRFSGVEIFPSYAALIESARVDAVYIATNHSSHVGLAKQAASAKKHIVCEKPVGISLAETEEMFSVVRDNEVFFMEAFMYRLHPQITAAIELVKSGRIGALKLIQAEFGFKLPYPGDHRIFDASDYGGGTLDAGGYPLSMARLFAGIADGQQFADPISIQSTSTRHESGVDDLAMAILEFPNRVMAQVSTGVRLNFGEIVRLYGTDGSLTIQSPWFGGGVTGGVCNLVISPDGGPEKTIVVNDDVWLYEHEINALTDAVESGRVEPAYPAMSWVDTIGNMTWLEKWSVGGRDNWTA